MGVSLDRSGPRNSPAAVCRLVIGVVLVVVLVVVVLVPEVQEAERGPRGLEDPRQEQLSSNRTTSGAIAISIVTGSGVGVDDRRDDREPGSP